MTLFPTMIVWVTLRWFQRAILYGLHTDPNPHEEDLYESARQFPLTYSPEDDPSSGQLTLYRQSTNGLINSTRISLGKRSALQSARRENYLWASATGNFSSAFPQSLSCVLKLFCSFITQSATPQLFYTSTLNLSHKHVPTICYTLPLYKQLELHMDTYCHQASEETDIHGLENALMAGFDKLRIHMEKALVSDYPLLGAGECFFITSEV